MGSDPNAMQISYTKIEKYQRCPFEYKCYTDKKIYKLYHKDTPPLVFGQLIHGVLNSFYKHLSRGRRNLEGLRELFKTKFLTHKEKHFEIFKNQATINQYVEKAKEQFKNFLASPYAKKEPYLATEENQRVKIDHPPFGDNATHLKNASPKGGGLELLAKVDRIDLERKGLHIIDYKTGRLWEPDIDPLQLNFYGLVVSEKFSGLPVVRKTYFYLSEGREIEVDVKAEDNEKTLSLTREIAAQIEADKKFSPRENDKCRFCDFKPICPLQK